MYRIYLHWRLVVAATLLLWDMLITFDSEVSIRVNPACERFQLIFVHQTSVQACMGSQEVSRNCALFSGAPVFNTTTYLFTTLQRVRTVIWFLCCSYLISTVCLFSDNLIICSFHFPALFWDTLGDVSVHTVRFFGLSCCKSYLDFIPLIKL